MQQLSRRSCGGGGLAPLCALLFALCGAVACGADEPPNIVFVIADDLGYGDLGCYGQQLIQTPNLDRMAAEGMKFTDFYAGSTVCAPSRCVLMTGLHTGHAFIRGNGKDNLRPRDVTVAEIVKQAGYATGMFGKWGLGHEGSTGLPLKQGFDAFFGYLDQHHAHNYYPSFLIRGSQRVPLKNVVKDEGEHGQGMATEKVQYSHDLIFAEALDFVREHADERFFLYLPVTLPHANNEARQEGMEIPDYGQYADKDWPEPQKGTAAMISRLDSDVGRLLDLLKELQLDEQTIVFFTSDNGPHAEGGNDPNFFDSNGPLRGIKRDLTEGGIRVPMIVRWPGRVEPGSTSDHVGYGGDLMATAAELAGTTADHRQLDSVSMVPTLLGKSEQQVQHPYLYWEFYEAGFDQAVRQEKWKAIRGTSVNKETRLYNLQKDLGESDNVASEHPQIVKRMERLMQRAHVPSDRWQPKKPR